MATTPIAPFFSEWGKKIGMVVGLIIAGFIVYRVTKKIIKEKDNREELQAGYNELDKFNQNPSTAQKITNFQAEQYANIIFTAVDGYMTDEDAVGKVFYKLKNNADFLALSKAFGIRKISSGYLNPEPDYKATLTEAITIDFTVAEKKVLNTILSKKKIKFSV